MDPDPYFRNAASPVSNPGTPAAETPAALLKTARWHAGLSQTDVAQRAQTSQPAVARFENGSRTPSLSQLRRLLAACGMRLDLALTPEPGLIDAPTRELLSKSPWNRLPPGIQSVLDDLVPLLRTLGLPVLLADRAAARLRGAVIRVEDVEFWLDESDVDIPALESGLEDIGAVLWPVRTQTDFGAGRSPRLVMLEGGIRHREIRLRGMPDFATLATRAVRVDLPLGSICITALSDTTTYWPRRDRDRLALQRAEGLRRELAGPELLS